jgi:hypothetical protein
VLFVRLARLGLGAGAVEGGAGRLLGVVDLDPVRRLPRRLEGLRHDHSDDLTIVPDPVGLQGGGGRALVHLRRG